MLLLLLLLVFSTAGMQVGRESARAQAARRIGLAGQDYVEGSAGRVPGGAGFGCRTATLTASCGPEIF